MSSYVINFKTNLRFLATAQETVLELEKEFCARKEATECLLEEMRQLKGKQSDLNRT